MLAVLFIFGMSIHYHGVSILREEMLRKGYRGAFVVLYTFLAILAIVWFIVYIIFLSRGSVG